jgi:hypothetical protein
MVLIETTLGPAKLLQLCRQIESERGRKRRSAGDRARSTSTSCDTGAHRREANLTVPPELRTRLLAPQLPNRAMTRV